MSIEINLPTKPKIVFKDGPKAVFEIEGLHPGYGLTIGNALRRVLLSSIPGAAITSMKIEGIQHEFSALEGVLEDMVEIMLKVKQIRIKLDTPEPQKLELRAKGEGEIKAGDIKCPAPCEIINKDLHLATLTSKKAELNIEFIAERGLGYIPFEQHKKEKLAIGTIGLDAIFSPIKKVNFQVEDMRVGERTDYNRLRLHLETDGTISPEEALNKASEIVINHFNLINVPLEFPGKEEKETKTSDLTDLGLSNRTINALVRAGIESFAQLSKLSKDKVSQIKGLGNKGIGEIQEALGGKGVNLI